MYHIWEASHITCDDKEKINLLPNNLPMRKTSTDNLFLRKKLKSAKAKWSDVQVHFEKSAFQLGNNRNVLHFLEITELNCYE